MDQLPEDLFHSLLRTLVFPFCSARHVQRLRLLGRVWNAAYLEATQAVLPARNINTVQPSRGGSVATGFLFERDSDQRKATVGVNLGDVFPRLDAAFGANRSPKVLASSNGLTCIRLAHPAEIVIWNPIGNQRIMLNPPDAAIPGLIIPDVHLVGLHVRVVDGIGHTPGFTVSFAWRDGGLGGDLFGFVSCCSWNSQHQAWHHEPNMILYDGLYAPANSISFGDSLYFLVSAQTILSVRAEDNVGGEIPFLWHARAPCLCVSRGRLAVCELSEPHGTIRIWGMNLEQDWDLFPVISLVPMIRDFPVAFRFNTHTTRSAVPQDPCDTLVDARVLGLSDDWIFLFQQGNVVRIRRLEHDVIVRRLSLRNPSTVFFPCSTFLRLSQAEAAV